MHVQAGRDPDACALIFMGRRLTYEWLDDRSEQLAALLIGAGVQPGDAVAVYMARSPDMIAALFAVLKAGAAYLPLDPEQPEARLETILSDASPRLVLSEAGLNGRLRTTGIPRLLCDAVPRVIAAALERPVVGPDDLAYILYTSGSTGRPKGVEVTHGAVLNLVSSFLHEPGFTQRDCMLGATTTAFDISVLEIFLPLSVGASLALAEQAILTDPHALAALIEEAGCTFAQATPSKWRYLMEAGWVGRAGLTVMCGGEAMARELADRLLTRCDAVWNVYGPTETTVWSTLARVLPGSEPPPIGWPVDNTSLHVLDEAGRRVRPGEVGELYIGGRGLARGYRNRPDLTRERFVQRGGERLYRTGDLVRRRDDGALECLGRQDHQVKLRGFRVELGEVEATLLTCDGVAWAAATTLPGEDGETTLVVYVAPRRGEAALDSVVLRRALSRRLPGYMMPSLIVCLDALPMTAGGKIDRNALPPPVRVAVAEAGVGVTADTATRLASIWASVLNLSAVSPQDNFFDLGGYSLLTLRLLRKIQEAFGRTLTMAQLFAAADLAAMARLLDDPAAPALTHIPLQPLGGRPPLVWFDVGPQMRSLAEHLAPDQPFIGLNLDPADPVAIDGRPCARQIGESLVDLVRRFQPHGPYRLGGWCRWGVMAYAAAEQLLGEGEEVHLLVLLDAVNNASPCQVFRRATRKGVEAITRRASGPPAAAASFSQAVQLAARRYRPPPYDGDVLLLRAADAEQDWDECSGWRDVVRGRLEVCDLPGDHTAILRPPHVSALADRLRSGLVGADGGGPLRSVPSRLTGGGARA